MGTGDQIVGGEGIGEFLRGLRIRTLQESVSALLKADASLLHAQSQPVMLIETDAIGERKIGADPYEYFMKGAAPSIRSLVLPLQELISFVKIGPQNYGPRN